MTPLLPFNLASCFSWSALVVAANRIVGADPSGAAMSAELSQLAASVGFMLDLP